MHQQERIFCAAELLVPAPGVQQSPPEVGGAFPADDTIYQRQNHQVHRRDHSHCNAPGTVLYPKLNGGTVDPDDTVPEHYEFRQEQHHAVFYGSPRRESVGERRPENNGVYRKADQAGHEERQYLVGAVTEHSQPQGGIFLQRWVEAEYHQVYQEQRVHDHMHRRRSIPEPHQQRTCDTQHHKQIVDQPDHCVGVFPEQFAKLPCELPGELLNAVRKAHDGYYQLHAMFSGTPKTVRSSVLPDSVRNIF